MDESSLARLLHRLLPEVEVESLAFLGRGEFCTAYLLNGVSVVRLAGHPEAARALEREARLLPALSPHLPTPVPHPTFFQDRAVGSAALSLHDLIPGEALTLERWMAFPDPDRRRLAETVGSHLRALHALEPHLYFAAGLPTLDHRKELEGLIQQLDGSPGGLLPDTLRRALRGCFIEALLHQTSGSYRPALLHGDFSPGHVLVNPETALITGIIDWGDAMFGDPARDFIFIYEDWGVDFLRLVLRGYGRTEGETGPFYQRILLRYLADQLAWTLEAGLRGSGPELDHGVAALSQGLRDMTP